MDVLKEFLKSRDTKDYDNDLPETIDGWYVDSNRKFEYTSLSGGRFAIECTEIAHLHNLLSNAYNRSKGKAGLKELNECITSESTKFPFFSRH